MLSERGFGRQLRLLQTAEYRRVFTEPRKTVDGMFTVLARKNGLDYPRLGLAISRKTVRQAVARNRIKRVVREFFRNNRKDLRGLDLVVISRRGAGERTNTVLYSSLAAHWEKMVRQCDKS